MLTKEGDRLMNALFSGSTSLFWLAAMVVFFIIEAAVPGLVSIWFGIGALAALISALLKAPLWLQFVWFIVVSLATLILTRPLAKKYVNDNAMPTNADMVIGRDCVITETIDNLKGEGAASVDGKIWTARSEGGEIIEKGQNAEILRIEGVKLIVKSKEII